MKTLLHVGCGPIKLPGFVNIDIDPAHKPDIVLDCCHLNERFSVETVDAIFSCHMLEHLDYATGVLLFLDQAKFAMKPGGVLRIVVPDLEKVAKAYAAGSDLKFIYGESFKSYYYNPESAAERFHFFITSWQHQIVFDFELLLSLLADTGFTHIKRCAFGQSATPELRGIDRFESESLCVEAVK